jgi:diguanylate cyclase (GGDEF)-like protein/PAS domain S-box-containing protein
MLGLLHKQPEAPGFASGPLWRMGPWKPPIPLASLLTRSLLLVLPISAAITVVLLPMVALYEHSRRDALEGRVSALVEAATLRVQSTLHEARAATGVVTSVPALQELLAAPVPSLERRRRMEALFRAQLREYESLLTLAVDGPAGQPLAQVSRAAFQLPDAARRRALAQAAGLRPGQIWVSSVQWPADRPAEVLLARPLFSVVGERRGTLLAVVSLALLARDFNRITNSAPSLQRGYLLSGEGRTINAGPDGAVGQNFAARYPQVWQRIQRQPRGVLDTSKGLFVYLTDPLRSAARRGSGGGLFVFESGRDQQQLAVVLQVPPIALYSGSAFAQPVGQALVALLYLLAGGASVGIARYQRHLDRGREQERQLRARLQAVVQSAGVGMCLCDSRSGRFLSVNDALCAFFGRSQAELLACTWQELTHPEDLAADQLLVEQVLRGERDSYRLRKRYRRPDGSNIWGDLVVACSRNADGTVRDLIGQISDVSELVAKTAYLEAASSAGVVGVWDWDVPRDRVTWDAVMAQLYGLPAEHSPVSRQTWEQAIHPDDKPFVLQELQAALRGWRAYQPRFRVIWPDGSIHHLQARSRTTYGPDGAPLRMIGVNYDITEQVEREQEVDQQRLLLATTFDALVDPLLVLTLDDRNQPRGAGPAELSIAEANPAAAHFFRRSQPQLLGQPLARVLPPRLNGPLLADLQAVVRGGPDLLADAQPVWLREGAEPLFLDLRAVAVRQGVVFNFRDVSAQRRASANLAASEERYRLLAENASDVVFRASLYGVTEWITDSVTPLVGWAPADLINRPFAPFVHLDDRGMLGEMHAAFARGERRQFRLRVLGSNGSYRWVGVNARGLVGSDGAVLGIVGNWRDAQMEVEAETELDRRARIDPLTGLYNRQEILEQLERLTQRQGHPAQRHGDGALAVLFCDIDHFKEINDRHGHGGGDAVLKALAQRLRASTRGGDLVGRLGGDELLVVLRDIPTLELAVAIAEKVQATACEPLWLPEGEVLHSLSIGVTLIHPNDSLATLVARADQAMYDAKQRGRDRVVAVS